MDDSGDFSNALRLDRNLTSGNIDGEAYEQKTFSAKGNAAKKRPTSRYSMEALCVLMAY